MGGFKCLERLKEFDDILDAFQEIGPLFQTFFPLHIEKCKIFLLKNEYENTIDYIQSKLKNARHFEIYKMMALCNLIHEGDYNNAVVNIDKMFEILLSQEPKNPELYFKTAQLFARICDRRLDIIRRCEIMVDKCLEFNPRNAKYLIEKGYYRL
jgi:hypothetical protein